VFSNSALYAYLDQTEPISTLNNRNHRKYSLQKLMQFSHENHVLDVSASKKNVSVWKDTCVSSSK
jgi:hypothetical protein